MDTAGPGVMHDKQLAWQRAGSGCLPRGASLLYREAPQSSLLTLLSFSHIHGLQPASTCFCSKIGQNAEHGAKQGALTQAG